VNAGAAAGTARRERPSLGRRAMPWRPSPGGDRAGWWRLCSHPAVISALVTALGAIVWVIVFPRVGTDLSAAVARAGWARAYPGSAYIFSWYGGIYPASYSLLAPYLLALAGTRLAMTAAVLMTAGLLAWLLARGQVLRPRLAAVWLGVALWTELSAGRAAFTLGLAAAAGCVVVIGARRPPDGARLLAAAGLALLCYLLSPVAALFLGVVAAALTVTGRWREGLAVGLGAGVPLVAMAAVFPGGVQPIGIQAWLPPLLAAAGVALLVPRRWPLVRIGAVIYGLGVIAAWAVPTPIGSNVGRLGELLVGPLLIGMAYSRPRWLLAAALAAAAVWQVAQPAADLAQGNAPPYSPQTQALARELRAIHAGTARVEAVPQYGHWESQELAAAVPLARGWERQVDVERNPLFYGGTLTPAAYYRWLRYNAVRYVAISAATPDPAAAAEATVVREGQPWLAPVWRDAFWRLYRVAGTYPLASPPGSVIGTTPAQITLRLSRAGTTIVRVHWSPLLRSTGSAVLARRGAWTSLTAPRAGTYTLSAPY
jgi:hypothetical protein